MFTTLTTSSFAASKVTRAGGTPAHAETILQGGDLTLAERCVR